MEASRGEAWERGFLGLHWAGKALPRVVPKESPRVVMLVPAGELKG